MNGVPYRRPKRRHMRVIDLRSDTVTKPSQAMRKAMMEAEVGDDVFGEDPTVIKLEETVAGMLGKEAALFVPTGTMGNQICIKVHTLPGQEVMCDWNSHIFNYEAGAASMLAGVQLKPVMGQDGIITAQQVEQYINDDDIHHAHTKLIALENTHNRGGGVVYPIDEIRSIRKVAENHGIPMHLDGARLFNAVHYSGVSANEYAKYFESVMICLSKGLGAPVGSVVAGSRAFIDKARCVRKAYGGGMRQAGIIAAGGLYALDNNINRLSDDHQHAISIAEIIAGLKQFSIDLKKVHTNIVIFNITKENLIADQVVTDLQSKGVLSMAFDKKRARLVTHLDLSDDDIRQTIDIFKKLYS